MDSANKEKICVVIPTYQYQLNKFEQASFDRIYNTLSEYKITLIKPHSLDFRYLHKDYPQLQIESFDESFFHGENGHNRLMLAEEFYERFANYDYILFIKLDCYIFEDKLLDFCKKGCDYISTLSIEKKLFFSKSKNELDKKTITGCESLSLRKVGSHLKALRKYKEKKEDYLKNKKSENVFWTTEVSEFTYPRPEDALSFAFDQQPKYCYKLNNNTLPFACCNWHQRGLQTKFWKESIKL